MRSLPVLIILALVPPLYAADPVSFTLDPSSVSPTPAGETSPPLNQPAVGITGDWAGRRTTLANAGLTVAGSAQLNVYQNFVGGISTSQTVFNYLLDLNLTLDTDKAFHHHGGTFFVDLQNHDGASAGDRLTGDIQGFSSIDAPHFLMIAQLWYQQKLFADLVTVKAGKIDANADFSVVEHGREFINAGFSYTPTMFPFPTYPDPALGGQIFFNPNAHFYFGAGAFYSNQDNHFLTFVGSPQHIEPAAGGTFLISEGGVRWSLRPNNELPGHAALGGWGHTGRFPNIPADATPATPIEHTQGTGGAYALLDQSVWQAPGPNNTTRDLGLFTLLGWADPSTNALAAQIAGGAAATGLLPGRPNDVLGLGLTWAQLGHTDTPHPNNYEIAYELFYKLEITRGLLLKPDLQYIVHPSGLHPDALVATLRLEIDF